MAIVKEIVKENIIASPFFVYEGSLDKKGVNLVFNKLTEDYESGCIVVNSNQYKVFEKYATKFNNYDYYIRKTWQ